MTEKNAAPDNAEAPLFRLQKMYIKDLSFENPNAPEIFLGQQPEPKVAVNLAVKNKKLENDHWEVSLSITATVSNDKKEGQTLFIVELEHAAVFLLKNIPEQHLQMVLGVDCPTMLLPFTRQIISQVSIDGGFIPFLIEPMNFLALFENAKKKKAENVKYN
ncbi:MAG: protein-export chaperone SecB [Deltaproteobacteria bacterium]|jgi:preprotein translocase subunit SecB|nr:protein-export chaperone SecB [Deltaproteobacteria bacterium]